MAIDFNSRLHLIGGYFATPLFDDGQFSVADYKKAYNLYHIAKDLGLSQWDLVGNEVVEHVQTQRLFSDFANLNYLREHLAANHMRIKVFHNVRRYRTAARKMYFYAWGEIAYTRPDGETIKGLLVLWDEPHANRFCVIRTPNQFWSEYDEV